MTTTLLMFCAIYHILLENPGKHEIPANKIKDEFLLNSSWNSKGQQKIILRTVITDNTIFEQIFKQDTVTSKMKASKLYKAYEKFYNYLNSKDSVEKYIDVLEKFEIVVVAVEEEDDNPQRVFENINSTGLPLTDGDKIRNFALMLNNEKARDLVYESYWKNIESKLTFIEKNKQIDKISDFFRNYLMCKLNESIKVEGTYKEFKNIFNKEVGLDHNIENLEKFYTEITSYLYTYLFIVGKCTIEKFNEFEENNFTIRQLQTNTIIPFFMNLLIAFDTQNVDADEVKNSYTIIENYIARRSLTKQDSKGFNQFFSQLYNKVINKQEQYNNVKFDDVLSSHLLEQQSKAYYISSDINIENELKTINFHGIKKSIIQCFFGKISDQSKESSILKQLQNKEIKLTIEHIMPKTLSSSWKNGLGEDWELIHNTWLDNIANITLTAYNSKYSNRSFHDKKTLSNGFNYSPLIINKYISEFEKWGEEELKERYEWLIKQIKNTWPYPTTTLTINTNNTDDSNYLWTPFDAPDLKRTKPNELILSEEDTKYPNSWTELYISSLNHIHEKYGLNNVLNSNPQLISSNPDKYSRPVHVTNDIYAEAGFAANDLINSLKTILSTSSFLPIQKEKLIKFSFFSKIVLSKF